MASIPENPSHNLTDESTMNSAGDANTDTSSSEGTFGILQRAVKRGGVTPEYASDGFQRGPGGGSSSD